MLNQVLTDSHIVGGIETLKIKKECPFEISFDQQKVKPLILMCTHNLAVTIQRKWELFLRYVREFNMVIDHQFYIDLQKIHSLVFPELEFKQEFGPPQNSFLDNFLNEIFYIYARSSPFLDNDQGCYFQKISQQLTPNMDPRSTQVGSLLFRKFFLQYSNYNFKSPNDFLVIRNNGTGPQDQLSVYEKIVTIMMKSKHFVNYLKNHTSIFNHKEDYEKTLTDFLLGNYDLYHVIIMVYDLLNKVTDGDFHSTLILKHVSLQILDPFIHPLSLSIFDFYEQLIQDVEEEDKEIQKKYLVLPKITFLNMDGYDFEFNWKLLDNYQDSCQYISVIDEMIESAQGEQFMLDLITDDIQEFQKAKNTYIIPIRKDHTHKSLNDMHFRHILDQFVYPLIKSFQPQVIMFSYSFAYFNQESDITLSSKLFTEITTHLGILSNYKVIFLPRLLSSGLQVFDKMFEKQYLNSDQKNMLYYLNNYGSHFQSSYKFKHTKCVNRFTRYADSTMKIVKSNSFYEKTRNGTYSLNFRKERYMYEILAGFLESCRETFLQEVKDKDKRMQDPNLQCADLMDYKITYHYMSKKLLEKHYHHYNRQIFQSSNIQLHTYQLLKKQHQRVQKKQDSQFVQYLAQDLKDYIHVFGNISNGQPEMVQIYLRKNNVPVYIHNKLSQYFVNYNLNSILLINVFSFKDIRELGIDSYQTCLVNFTIDKPQGIGEISIIQESSFPIVFRSLCFDKANNNLFIIYGQESKKNQMQDSIDIYNFPKNTLTTIYRSKLRPSNEFARAYASSLVFSFDKLSTKTTEIWTFGGSYLGTQPYDLCDMIEKIKIEDGQYRSQKIPKETIHPTLMRPMYGCLMLNINIDDEKAILIIGGSQNELLVNVQDQVEWAYKFQQIEDMHIVSKIKILGPNQRQINSSTFFSQNLNIFSDEDQLFMLNESTEILGKSYRQIVNYEIADPYTPYGILSVTTLKILFGSRQQDTINKRKFDLRPLYLYVQNQVINSNQVLQPFAQMHKNMKFYYKEYVNTEGLEK